jgi:hypothetical protein
MLAIDFFTTSDTHRCPKTNQKYSIKDNAYLIAYLRAKEEYRVYSSSLEEELATMGQKSPKAT